MGTKENDEGKKEYDVFFWLGAETSQDEAGTAAYKTVELDDYLGDLPVQYREVQGNESKKFLNMFPKVTILEGGVESGFRNVKPKDYKPRLLHVCGYKKHVQVYQVKLDAANLNDSDAFVLDCGLTLYQFNGGKSSAWEKRKANAIVDELQASRHGKVKTTLIIDGVEDDGNPLIEDFWGYFGGKPDAIKEEEEEKKQPDYTLSLQHVSDASGVMECNEVCSGKLDKSKLDSNDAFILDGGGSVFIWIGKGANNRKARRHEVRRTIPHGTGPRNRCAHCARNGGQRAQRVLELLQWTGRAGTQTGRKGLEKVIDQKAQLQMYSTFPFLFTVMMNIFMLVCC